MTDALLILLLALLGGWISRMCGGGKPELPFGLDTWIYCFPYAVLFWLLSTSPLFLGLGLLSFAGAFVGKRTGHGQYLSYGHALRGNPKLDERLDFIVRLIAGAEVPVGQPTKYYRCAVGMAVTGLAETLLPGLLYAAAVDPLSGAIIAVSGAFKTVGYQVGWFLYDRGFQKLRPNIYGEFLNGFKAWGLLAWVIF